MQGNRRQYSFTSYHRDERFSKGPISIGGQDIFVNPEGYARVVVAELRDRQQDVYGYSGIPVLYKDGKLVERLRGLKRTKGHRSIPGARTIPELQKLVENLI